MNEVEMRRREALISRATAYYLSGNYAEAVKICDEDLKRFNTMRLCPEAGEVFLLRARCKRELSQYEEATKDLEMAFVHKPIDASAEISALIWVERAGVYILEEKYDWALRASQEALGFQSENIPALKSRGEAQLRLGHFELALQDFDKASKLDQATRDWRLVLLRAETYIKLHRYAEAMEELQRFLQLCPEKETNLKSVGIALFCQCCEALIPSLFDDKEYETAIPLCNVMISSKSSNTFALDFRGRAKYFMGKAAESVEDFDKLLKLAPKSHGVWMFRGKAKSALRQFKEALSDVEESLRLKPDYCEALEEKGNILNELERYEEAEVAFAQVLKLEPGNRCVQKKKKEVSEKRGMLQEVSQANVRLAGDSNDVAALELRANARRRLGLTKEAISDFDEVLRLSPKSDFALCFRGAAKLAAGDCHGAIQDCEKAIGLNSKNALAWMYCGASKYRLDGLEAEALSDLNEAHRLDPNNVQVLINRGCVNRALSKNEAALQDFSEAIKLDELDDFSWESCAIIYSEKGDYGNAVRCCNEAVKLNPKNVRAMLCRGMSRVAMKLCEPAIVDFNMVLNLDPQQSFALMCRADSKKMLGKFEAALSDFEQFLQKFGEDELVLEGCGVVRFRLGDYSAAERDLKRCLKINPRNSKAQELLEKVHQQIRGQRKESSSGRSSGNIAASFYQQSPSTAGPVGGRAQSFDPPLVTASAVVPTERTTLVGNSDNTNSSCCRCAVM